MGEIEDILELLESDNPDQGIEQAKNYLNEHDLSEEDQSRLNYGIAAGLFKLANYRGALDWLQKCNDPRRFIFKGFCYLELEEFNDAVDAFDRAADAEPERRDEADLMKAQSLMLADRVHEAQEHYQQLVDRDVAGGNTVDVESKLGLAVTRIETEDYIQAKDLLKQIIEEHDQTEFKPEAMFYLVEVYESIGQVEKAVEWAEDLKDFEQGSRWEDVAGDLLQRLHDQSQNRQSKLRDYEF